MSEDIKRYLFQGINPFATEQDPDEALRKKAVSMGIEEPTQADIEEDAALNMGRDAIERKAQLKYPDEAEPVIASEEEVSMPVEEPQEEDKAAEQAQVAKDSLDKPVDPSQTNMLNTTLTAEDSGLKQEELLRRKDPISYVREKYGIAPGAQRDEMMADTDYESLKSMQKRTGILDALSDFDSSIGGMGDWKLLEAKKAGYAGNYKGGALGKMGARERANFEERSKFRDTDLERQSKGLGLESTGEEFKNKMFAFDKALEDEKQLSRMEGPIYEMSKELYRNATGKDLPAGISPKVLFQQLPQFKDLLKEQMGNAFTSKENDLRRAHELKLKQMEIDAKKEEAKNNPDKNPFTQTLVQEQAKDYQTMQNNALKVDEQFNNINDALDEFTKYTQSSSFGGTGPFATGFGLKRFTNESTGNLDNKFKKISMDKLVNNFSGMSKAVDSNTERQAFQATQPDITNDDRVNAEVLLGAKSMAIKTKAEAEAQRRHINAGNKDLTNYESPIIGKTTTVVDSKGKMHLIPTAQLEDAKKNGYYDLDTYAQQFILRKPGK